MYQDGLKSLNFLVALGGNALLRRGEDLTTENQVRNRNLLPNSLQSTDGSPALTSSGSSNLQQWLHMYEVPIVMRKLWAYWNYPGVTHPPIIVQFH